MRESINSGVLFDFDKLESEANDLSSKSESENFWSDRNEALKIINRLNYCKEQVETYRKIEGDFSDLSELLELADDSMLNSIESSIDSLVKETKEFELQVLFAGGTEAQDWADMLYRMYVMFAESHKMKIALISYEPADDAGIKSVTIKISGNHAYGLLKGEKGVHRLVRISPFDANKRRHTSFASVNVIPEFKEDNVDIQIPDSELKIDTYRSGGAGGQNVNKVETAVRITHLPTGIVVSGQIERSQLLNKETAMGMLKSKLYLIELEKRQNKLNSIVGEKKNIEWGSQIRSYVFCPYTLVKDNRTDFEMVDVEAVMNGDIEGFLYAYLQKEAKQSC